MLPPEDDDSVAVLVIEPNTGVAHALEHKYHKKQNVSRLFVLNCAIAGPSEEVDSKEVTAKFGRDATAVLVNSVKTGVQEGKDESLKKVIRRKEGNAQAQNTVPTLSLATLLQALPRNVTLQIL